MNFEDEILIRGGVVGGGGGGGGVKNCNIPKYTLFVFDIFRIFCKHNLNVS